MLRPLRSLAVLVPLFAAGLPLGWPLAAAAEALSWEACVALTAQHNAALRAARDNVRAAEHQVRSAAGAFLPQIEAGAGRTHYDYAGASPPPAYSASLSATQNLFAGFRDQATVAQAEAHVAAAEAALRIAKAQASFDLKSAFAALRFAQDSLKLADDIIRRREENLKLVELRFEGGRENKGSYYLSRAALAQARYERLQAEHAWQVAQEQLARVLGRDQPRDLDVAGQVPETVPPETTDIETQLPQVPEYQQALAQERAAEQDVRIARAGLLPSLHLSGSAARQGEDWSPGERRNSAGVSLTVPIFSGGKDYYATESAAANLAAARANRENTARTLRTRLQQGYTGYVQAEAKRAVDREFVEAASTRAEIARAKYNNGLLSFEDWDIIENDLINRQKAALASRRDRVTAEAAWEQARGAGVIP
jgi:outer membrane protein TolC